MTVLSTTTVEPVLSGHPRGMANISVHAGCTEYMSNTTKTDDMLCMTVYSLCTKSLSKSLTLLTAAIKCYEKGAHWYRLIALDVMHGGHGGGMGQ